MKRKLFFALTLLVAVAMQAQTNSVPVNLPRAEAFYDFSRNGLKQAPIGEQQSTSGNEYDEELGYYVNKTTTTITWQLSADVTGNFTPQELYGKITHVKKGEEPDLGDANVAWVEDINGDGKADLSSFSAGIFVKTADGCERIDGLAVTNMDINRDGRMDYLILDRSRTLSNRSVAQYGAIAYQLSDGSFQTQQMQVFTWDEFVEQMTDEERDQYQNPQNYSLGEVSRYTYTAQLGGASLARAPKRNAPGSKKAPGAGTLIGAPTKALDMNKDGLVDLIDEKNGIIYTNMDNGKWVWTTTNGAIVPADLNNDGVTDFVFPGEKLYTVIYDKTAKSFTQTVLYQNATSDNIVYCYDFDKDGDIDILATFTAENNPTGYAYTCFFTNDGQGAFKKQAEQDYEDYALAFVGMQDLDGDGYYDLLAYTPKADRKYDLVWVKGKSGLKFNTTPQVLATDIITRETYWDSSKQPFSAYPANAEDLDGDGKMEIWVSGTNYGSTELYSIENAVANQAPNAPSRPTLSYSNGLLTITWGNGSDDKTATGDLTYALRIGTTAGGNDLLAAHALANGTRRNFLDGNMGKEHSYTIDLTSYTPATIYVAVQTIDAQHAGSVWSEEATVVHDLVPVEFALDRTTININETAVLTFTALPEGYSHQWTIQDGSYVQSTESASKLILSFTSGGEKTITHTVTTPNGGTKTASATIFVMPAGIGEKVELTDEQILTFFCPTADYTYDGRMDGVLPTNRSSGAYYSFTVQRGKENGLFSNAPGLWNTNILTEGMYVGDFSDPSFIWYDWNKDGNVDLLFVENYGRQYNYAYLPHEEDGYTLSSRVDDENLEAFFAEKIQDYRYFNYLLTDVDNNGYLDSVAFVLNPLAGTDNYGSDIYGLYVWYKEGGNVIAEGFLVPAAGNAGSIVTECYITPEEHCLVVNYAREFNGLYPIITQADTRPAAPTNIRATMTDDGLLITWDAAVDDHTPAASMRYNLSVKQQSTDTYLVSPQNGGNEDAMYIPGYAYVEGTSYLIPTSELGTGRYDIQLQALDRQNKLSVFSQTVTATVMRNPIEVQTFGCANDYITVSYRGEETTGTPVWNFDGGVANGEGFGPYEVYWETGGEKAISLTLDGQTYSATITIDNPGELAVSLPNVLYIGTPATASVPSDVSYEWFAQISGGDLHPIDQYGIILNMNEHHEVTSTVVSYDYRLKASGLTVTAQDISGRQSLTLEEVVLYLRVTNANGCEAFFMTPVTVMAATAIPTLTLVTTDAYGHNVIAWTNADAFTTVNIYKEGEVLNEYELIGSETASVGSFTDTHSDASQKAERYRITGVLANENESPASGVHKTVHLAINRGIEEGTFNLIWNEYAGADVVSYNILRGATPTSLEEIATVASSNVSYTDRAPVDEKPYYVLEYVLSNASAAPANNANRAPKANVAGRSNVVDRRNAEEGIEDIHIDTSDAPRKIMVDNVIYILRGEKVYTLTGQEVK